MKTFIKFVVAFVIAIFAVDMCMDSDDSETSSNEPGVYNDSDEDVEAEAEDVYGNAADDDNASSDQQTAVSNWGDGTCRAITTKEFYKLVASKNNSEDFIGEGPVVVDFWASWCGYCRQIDPYLKALAKKYKGQVQFYKVNADENEAVTKMYGIEALPTLFFCAGSDITIKEGAYSQDELDKMIQKLLK